MTKIFACIFMTAAILLSIASCKANRKNENRTEDSVEENTISIIIPDISEESVTESEEESIESSSHDTDASKNGLSEEDDTSTTNQNKTDSTDIEPSTAPETSGDDNKKVLYAKNYRAIGYGPGEYYPDHLCGENYWNQVIAHYGADSYYHVLILVDSKEYYDFKHSYLDKNMYYHPNNPYVYYPTLSINDYIKEYKWMYENDASTLESFGMDAELHWAFYSREEEKHTQNNPENVFYDYGFIATVRGDVLLNYYKAVNEHRKGGTVFWLKEGHTMQDLYYECEGNWDSVYDAYVAEGPGYMQFSKK